MHSEKLPTYKLGEGASEETDPRLLCFRSRERDSLGAEAPAVHAALLGQPEWTKTN